MKAILRALILLLSLTACQASPTESPLPTLVRFPSLTPSLHPSESPMPLSSFTPSPTNTPTLTPTTIPTIATKTISPSLTPFPSATATPLPEAFFFGLSAGGRNLEAYRYGTGANIIMLVGGIHAGFETNSSRLVQELQLYFESNPSAIREGISFLMIPQLNPDGLIYGRSLQGRFNGNSVDLNRNWGCGWQEEAFFRDMNVSAGGMPFSEPETRALGSLIQRIQPAAVLFYHAAANGVYAGSCNGSGVSDDLAVIYGESSGYPYTGDGFSAYVVTGTAPAWVDSLGIPAADIELSTADATDYARNLRAILALQDWVLGN